MYATSCIIYFKSSKVTHLACKHMPHKTQFLFLRKINTDILHYFYIEKTMLTLPEILTEILYIQ